MGKLEDLQAEEAELGDAIAAARVKRARAKEEEAATREQLNRVRTLRAIRAAEEAAIVRHTEAAARLRAQLPVEQGKQPAPPNPPRERSA